MFPLKAFMKLKHPVAYFAFKLGTFLAIVVVGIVMWGATLRALNLFWGSVFLVPYLDRL